MPLFEEVREDQLLSNGKGTTLLQSGSPSLPPHASVLESFYCLSWKKGS